MTQEQLRSVFIGPRAEMYIRKWSDNKWYFCWAGLFFSIFWLLYRKMYMFAVYILLIGLMFGYLIYALGYPIEYNLMINLWVSLIIGIFGNMFYRNHVAAQIKKFQDDSKHDLKMLELTGGVTWSVPIAWLLLQVLAGIFLLLPWIQHTFFPPPQPIHIEYYYVE